ncbi:hypothetical protein Tco_0931631, partial [Tanacetum coccineum]
MSINTRHLFSTYEVEPEKETSDDVINALLDHQPEQVDHLGQAIRCSILEQLSANNVFSRSMQNFECSSSSEKQSRTTKEKHTSSEVHHQADSGSVPARVSTSRSDMHVAIIGDASPSLNRVPSINKDTVAH